MTNRLYSTLLVTPLLLAGCKSSPPAAPATVSRAPAPAATYPARPTAAPAAFKIFHHGNSSFTLTVTDKATDDQLSSLVWQLRDAARTHSFDSIHIPQRQVDADGKTVWFHIYRGTKCGPEKYAPGNPPCGAAYHAAADYTFDTHSTPPWDKGVIMHGADDPHPTALWDPDAAYSPPQSVSEVLDHLHQIGAQPVTVRGHLWVGKEGSMILEGKRGFPVGYSQQFRDKCSFTCLIQSVRKTDVATVTGHFEVYEGKQYLMIDNITFLS